MTTMYYGHRGRRRWPIVTGALVLLVLLLGGGAYGAWWYNQQQYYVGVQDGYVAVFQGTNQSVAGMSLSKLLTRSTLQVSQLGLNDQNTLTQTISKSSVTDAKSLIDGLQNQADLCHQQWTALATWQAKTVSYNAAVARDKASKAKPKPTVPASDAPGPQPATPDPDSCAPASAFGIPASALPGAQPGRARDDPDRQALGDPHPNGHRQEDILDVGGRVSSMTMPSPALGSQPPEEAAVTRRSTELLMTAFALGLVALAFASTAFSLKGQHPSTIIGYIVAYSAIIIGAHLAVRKFAPFADPLLLPIATALNGLGLVMIYRLTEVGRSGNPGPTNSDRPA